MRLGIQFQISTLLGFLYIRSFKILKFFKVYWDFMHNHVENYNVTKVKYISHL